MIVTEEQAKIKRCQESFGDRYLTAGGDTMMAVSMAGGGYALQSSPICCIGSACMAWRWRREDLYRPAGPNAFDLLPESGDYSTTHGYCGKAGKP